MAYREKDTKKWTAQWFETNVMGEKKKRRKRGFETKREAAIRAYKVYGITTTARLYEDDTAERYFHIYYNPSKQAAERERLEQRIEKLRQFIQACLS